MPSLPLLGAYNSREERTKAAARHEGEEVRTAGGKEGDDDGDDAGAISTTVRFTGRKREREVQSLRSRSQAGDTAGAGLGARRDGLRRRRRGMEPITQRREMRRGKGGGGADEM